MDERSTTTPPLSDVLSEERELAAPAAALLCRTIRPASTAWARLGIVHGYGDHSGRYLHFMNWLAQRGVACHTFDFRGHGRSGGRRGYVARWQEFIHDLRAFLSQRER